MSVNPGEEFAVETQMNRGPWIESHPNRIELEKKLVGGNPSSGCIYINGAVPGQMLSVAVNQIDPGPIGYTKVSNGSGAMPGWLGSSTIGEHSKIVEIRDRKIIWSDSLSLDVRP
ncbi:MAG: hypothetical protein HN368_20975, partial [Spirochaetales bacterium]|nr:hypothetical protein [Spirochaetales bacterium]